MAFKMKGSAFKLNNVATKSALEQASPMKDTKTAPDNGNPMEADKRHKASVKHDAGDQHVPKGFPMKSPMKQTESDEELLARYKLEKPEVYEKMMNKYKREAGGGSSSLGTGQQGSHTYTTKPFPIETATGIDWIDNYTKGGRRRLNAEKADEVNTRMIDYIKKGMGTTGGLSELKGKNMTEEELKKYLETKDGSNIWSNLQKLTQQSTQDEQ